MMCLSDLDPERERLLLAGGDPDLDRLLDLDLLYDGERRLRLPRSRLLLRLRDLDLDLPRRPRPPPPPPPRPPPSRSPRPPRLAPVDISTRMRFPQSLVPSSPLTASLASLLSSNSTKAKPGGFLATQTSLSGPYLVKASSMSYLLALFPRLPMYTLQATSQSRWRPDMMDLPGAKSGNEGPTISTSLFRGD